MKLDKGKASVRFKSLDDLPLDVIGEVIASTPMETYIEIYRAARKKTAKGRSVPRATCHVRGPRCEVRAARKWEA